MQAFRRDSADDIRSRVAGVGGTIATLIGFLKTHSDNASVCEAVCLALLNLGVDRQSKCGSGIQRGPIPSPFPRAANQEAIANGGGILATLSVMGKHKKEAKLIEAASGMLAMLAIHPGLLCGLRRVADLSVTR